MRQITRTLRFKLVVLYLVVFGVIQVSLSLFVLNRRSTGLHQEFDVRLVDRSLGIMDAIGTHARTLSLPVMTTVPGPGGEPLYYAGSPYQLRDANGKLIAKCSELLDAELPWTPTSASCGPTQRRVFETLEGEITNKLLGTDSPVRLLTMYRERVDNSPYYVQIARSLGPTDKLVDDLADILVTMLPIGLVLAGGASWFMARRSLAPIGRIAREARELTAAHLDRRIPLPPGSDEVGDLAETINGMLDRLESAFYAQQRFAANAAHELKTPLSVLLGQSQVILQRVRSAEEYARFVAGIQDEVRRLAQIVDSLLTLARADAGLPLPMLVQVSVNEVAADAVQHCSALAQQFEVRLIPVLAMPESDDDVAPFVQGDADLLNLMLSNLVRNAIRYSPKLGTVEINIARAGDRITIAVRDSGPGIPDEHLSRLFERFYQVPYQDGRPAGTGLGLAIARGVARMHGGDITAANRPTGGCEFVVGLPMSRG